MKQTIRLVMILILFSSRLSAGVIPDFRLKDLDNNLRSYSDLKGKKLTVIDFWATWCKPCLRSIPEMERLSRQFADTGVVFVGISVDGPRNQAKVKPFCKSLGISYTILLDINSEVMSALQVTSLPTLFLVNDKNEIVFTQQGFQPGAGKELEQQIHNLLQPSGRDE